MKRTLAKWILIEAAVGIILILLFVLNII